MKKVFLLLTLIATTFSAWASTYSNLYVAGAGTRKEEWTSDKITMTKNGNIFTYTGYFYVAGSNDGFKIATNSTDFTDAFHPAGGSHVVITSGTTYNLTKTASPDSKFRVPSEGWYTITIDQSKTPETLKMESRQSPLELYPSGSGTSIGWKTTTVMKETSNGSGIYAGEITFNPASSNSEFKFFTNTNTSLNFHYGPADPSNKSLPSVGTYNIKYYSSSKDGDIKFQVNNNALSGKFYVKVNVIEGKMYVKPISTISFTSNPTSKAYTDAAFNVAVTAQSKGAVTYSSSNPNVASIDAYGKVTPHVPGTTTITAKVAEDNTYGPNTVNYTLTVTGTVPAFIKKATNTVGGIKGQQTWNSGDSKNNLAIDNVITLNYGKFYNTSKGGELRYYHQNAQAGRFTIQAKAGVIIQSVKFKYTANSGAVLTWAYSSNNVAKGDSIKSDTPYKVDANAVTIHAGKTGTGSNPYVNVTDFEITYFDPSEGVAVTKTLFDLAKNQGLKDNICYQNVALNEAINIHADNTGTMRYSNSGFIACYRWTGSIDISARKGATIHYVKVTYVQIPNYTGVLSTKSTTGSAVAVADRIASDSVIFVNSNSLKLYVGNTNGSDGRIGITKIYVNYTDGSDVVVDNFDNCGTKGSTDPVPVVGVNDKINWTFTNFSRKDTITNRMYYDQSIKLNKGGKIFTPITGALDEVAFDWHPTEANKNIKFYVKAGGTTYTVDSAAAKMDKAYTINFKKNNIQDNDTFAIMVDANSGTALEIGHVSIKPVLTYSASAVSINANEYQPSWKYTNNTLINNTGATASYSITDSPDVAVIEDASSGEVTIKGAGTVKVTAEAGGKSTSYDLTINLLDADVKFAKKDTSVYLSDSTYTVQVTKSTSADLSYELKCNPVGGATIISEDPCTIKFTAAGTYIVKASALQQLPYKAGVDSFTLTVNNKQKPEPYFESSSLTKDINDGPFTNALHLTYFGEGLGDTTYVMSNDTVATVDDNGEVTIIGAGTVKIKARLAEGASFAADSAEYTLTVLPLPEMSFAENSKFVYLNAGTVTNALTISPGAGAVTYESSADSIATIDGEGTVTIVKDGTVIITAKSVKSDTYSAHSADYSLTISPRSKVTALFAEEIVNKVQGFDPFTNALTTASNGKRHYFSSDTRVATVNDSTGLVTKGEKPGTTTIGVYIDSSATYAAIDTVSYTLKVSGAPIADMKKVSKTVEQIRNGASWPVNPDSLRNRTNIAIDDNITLSNGKYYAGTSGEFRYYLNNTFTIQAKAGVIIRSIKFNYDADNNMVIAKVKGTNVGANDIIKSDTAYTFDANAVTFYASSKGSTTNQRIYVHRYEITYFDPSEGVAVTKMVNDLGKSEGLDNDHSYKNIAVNQAISLCTNDDGNLKYYTSGVLNCYRHKGAIEIKARPGATIHHVKITYTATEGCLLTKYKGTGFSILPVDQIASDSILYVNANSIKLDVGTSQSSVTGWPSISITKIYVNYTDGDEVVVDNFNNCTAKSGDSVVVAGVGGKYDWTFKKFARDNAQRMYYDQSIKLNAGGKIYTPISGALKEVAFDWHPTEKDKQVKFYVKAGNETITVDSTMADTYTLNFKKANIQNNDTFAIEVDNASATTLEIGHVSITPYITYAQKEVEIDAKNYKDAGWKYTNGTLVNNTGVAATYSMEGSSDVAVIEDATSGEVTIKGAGTVTVKAEADGKSASYQLTINLENTAVKFDKKDTTVVVNTLTYQQQLTDVTVPDTGKVYFYSMEAPEGATIDSESGLVTFNGATGTYIIKGRLEQNLPFAAAEDIYTLTVNNAEKPNISYAIDSLAKDINDPTFINELSSKVGVGDSTFTSSNTDVATVDDKGWVTIVGSGKTTIKVVVAENASYAADSASYILYVKPLPEMSFEHNDTIAYQNTGTLINTLTVSPGAGAVTYESSNESSATVIASTGVVTIGIPGEATITAKTASSDSYSAGSASYHITVSSTYSVKAWFDSQHVEKNTLDEPFTNSLNLDPESKGTITYTSSDSLVATVAANGTVTMQGRTGTTIITANIASTATYEAASASFELTVNPAPTPGGKTVTGNIAQIAERDSWSDGQYYSYFKLDNLISVSDSNRLHQNSQYLESEECVRFYQDKTKGQFMIRAKAGVIIQSYKFTYTSTNDGVVTNNTNGANTAEANRILSNTTYKCDANKLVFYTGSTSNKTNGEVHITNIAVKYFDPKQGVEVTRTGKDLVRQCKLQDNKTNADIALNNVIKLHNEGATSLKSYSNGSINCYRHTGAIDIIARPGAIIHYVKVTYAPLQNGYMLTKYWGTNGGNIQPKDQIASDSILYVNADSLRLRVGYVGDASAAWSGVTIKKVYVVYTDSTASVDNFNNLTAIYGGATATEVAGIDGVYDWKITQFNRDSLRRIGYDQSIMLRQDGGKIETAGTEGGVKEVAFDWCASNNNQGAKFAVKVGTETIATIDSAKTGGWLPMTYTATEIKKNGAFSIEVDATSGSQVEFAHISLTPYLLYTTKEADVELGNTYQMAPQIDNRDNETAITYTIESGEGEITSDGKVTPSYPGDMTIQAEWDGVTTTYTLHVSGTLTLKEAESNAAKITANAGKSMDVKLIRTFAEGKYNTFCVPFNITRSDLATALGTEITSLATIDENSSAKFDDEKKNLDIMAKELEGIDSVKAGKPYLLKITSKVENPTFTSVTIGKANDSIASSDGSIKFYGITSPFEIPNDNRYLFMSNNKLNWNNTGVATEMKGLRSYFYVKGMIDDPTGVSARLVFRQPDTPTGMQNAQCTMQSVGKMIINNQLVIIRDGVKYNAQGVRL